MALSGCWMGPASARPNIWRGPAGALQPAAIASILRPVAAVARDKLPRHLPGHHPMSSSRRGRVRLPRMPFMDFTRHHAVNSTQSKF